MMPIQPAKFRIDLGRFLCVFFLLPMIMQCGDIEPENTANHDGLMKTQSQSLTCTQGYRVATCHCNDLCAPQFCQPLYLYSGCPLNLPGEPSFCETHCGNLNDVDTDLPPTGIPTFKDKANYLFDGSTPLQSGQAWWAPIPQPGAQQGAIAGTILDTDGALLEDVTISVKHHPEFGEGRSRSDGRFELAVDCNQNLQIVFRAPGYLSIQRRVKARCEQFITIDPVAMTPLNAHKTTIDLSAPISAATQGETCTSTPDCSGNMVCISGICGSEDIDGQRRVIALFPDSIDKLEIKRANGTTATLLPPFDVRMTEYTVGDGGYAAMPGRLPPSTAYTYAVEMSVEDPSGQVSIAADDTVRFTKFKNLPVSIPVYVDNFLDFPVGSRVPSGYYDRVDGAWKASKDGCVIEITGGTLLPPRGQGRLAIVNKGNPPSGHPCKFTLSVAEREKLWALYGDEVTSSSPKSLWRVPLSHFSPHDFNWPWGLPEGAVPPDIDEPTTRKPIDDPCRRSGSIIECENRILGESIAMPGTGTALVYNSGRQPGYELGRTLHIPLMKELPEAPLTPPIAIDLQVDIAGNRYTQRFAPSDNLSTSYHWNGKDLLGRVVYGAVPYRISVSWIYEGVEYQSAAEVLRSFGIPGNGTSLPLARRIAPGLNIAGTTPSTVEFDLSRHFRGVLNGQQPGHTDIGGWTLAGEHVFDVTSNQVTLGDGTTYQIKQSRSEIVDIVGNGLNGPPDLSADPVETGIFQVNDFDIRPDNKIHIMAQGVGEAAAEYIVTPGPNRMISAGTLNQINAIKIVSDGPNRTFYSAYGTDFDPNDMESTWCTSIIRVNADGSETHVAGNSTSQPGVAPQGYRGSAFIPCIFPNKLKVGADGTLYMALRWTRAAPGGFGWINDSVIASLTPNGILTVLAGGGSQEPDFMDSIGNPAPEMTYRGVDILLGEDDDNNDIELDSKGNIFILDRGFSRILKLRPDGQVELVAGNNQFLFGPNFFGTSLDEQVAHSVPIGYSYALAIDSQDQLYFSSSVNGYKSNDLSTDAHKSHAIYRIENGIIKYYAGAESNFAGVVYNVSGHKTKTNILSVEEMEFDADDTLYFYDELYMNEDIGEGGKIRAIRPPKTQLENQAFRVPSKDGSLIYTFNAHGLHLKTEDSITGVVLKEFIRDVNGLLLSIENRVTGARTTIDRATSSSQIIIEGLAPGVSAGNGFSYALAFGLDNMLSSVTRPDQQSNSLDYDTGGLLTKMIDYDGDMHQYQYDVVGHLEVDTKPVGSLTLTNGTLPGDMSVNITTAEGLTTHYSVDNPQSELYSRTIEYPDGSQMRISHPIEDNGLCVYPLTGSTDEEHHQCRFIEARDGMHTELHYSPDPRPFFAPTTRHVTRSIQSVPNFLDSTNNTRKLSQLVETKRSTDTQMSTGETVTWKEEVTTYRDSDGNPDTTVDRASFTWQHGHIANPIHPVAAYSWVSLSPEGRKSESFFNADGRLIEINPPGPTRTIYHYNDPAGRLSQIELKNNAGQSRVTNFIYDSKGRVDSVMVPGIAGKKYTFPDESSSAPVPVGLPDFVEQLDAAMNAVRKIDFDWDAVGQLIGIETPPDPQPHGMTYTPDGNLATYTTPMDNSGISTTLDYNYDLDGKLKSIQSNNVPFHQRNYAQGRLTERNDYPFNVQRSYDYYSFTTNLTNRLKTAGLSDNRYYNNDIEYEWNGSLLTSTQHQYQSDWHGFNHLISQEYHDGDLSLKSRTVDDLNGSFCPLGCETEFKYSADGLLTNSGPLSILRDPATGHIDQTIAGQSTTYHLYDDYGDPNFLSYSIGAQGIAQFEIWERDDLGRILRSAESLKNRVQKVYDYQYSPEGYLEKVWINADPDTDPATYSYVYDDNGSRKQVTQRLNNDTSSWLSTYDSQDRLLSFDCIKYLSLFDPCTVDGNYPKHTITYLSSDSSPIRQGPGGHANGDDWEYSYDASSNLLRIELLDSTDNPIDYQVNALDQRVAKHRLNQFSPEVGKHWLWSTGGQLLAEFDENGNIIRRFIYATHSHVPDMMRAKINGTWGLYRFMTDWRGSVRLVVNVDTGAIVQRLDYTPFGRVLEDSNPGFQPFGFAGGLYDHETGLVRFGARDYNPLIGRWTSKDPILFGGGDTNLYRYVGNDPVNFIDPSGLEKLYIIYWHFYGPFWHSEVLLEDNSGTQTLISSARYRGLNNVHVFMPKEGYLSTKRHLNPIEISTTQYNNALKRGLELKSSAKGVYHPGNTCNTTTAKILESANVEWPTSMNRLKYLGSNNVLGPFWVSTPIHVF